MSIAFGSDVRALYEVGEFTLHMNVLQQAGVGKNLKDVLFSLE